MANQNVPTHIFSGGIALQGNSFPSTAAVDITYGGFAPTFEVLDDTVTPQTISTTDGLVFVITPSQNTTLNLPAVASITGSRIYTFFVRDGGAFAVTFTAGGVAIPSGTGAGTTVTAVSKSSLVYVIYKDGVVVSTLIEGAA